MKARQSAGRVCLISAARGNKQRAEMRAAIEAEAAKSTGRRRKAI